MAIEPFLPHTSAKLRGMLNLPVVDSNEEFLTMMMDLAEGEHLLKAGHQINKGEHLFQRIDDDVIEAQITKLHASKAQGEDAATKVASTPLKEEITYDDFSKLDMRTATVLHAEKVEKADKLLRMRIDLGFEERTVVSGIAKHFNPDDIIGRKVVLLANLAPRKIRGVESQGMVLMAEDENGVLGFIAADENWENGSPIS